LQGMTVVLGEMAARLHMTAVRTPSKFFFSSVVFFPPRPS
jgi:hypothetical protein